MVLQMRVADGGGPLPPPPPRPPARPPARPPRHSLPCPAPFFAKSRGPCENPHITLKPRPHRNVRQAVVQYILPFDAKLVNFAMRSKGQFLICLGRSQAATPRPAAQEQCLAAAARAWNSGMHFRSIRRTGQGCSQLCAPSGPSRRPPRQRRSRCTGRGAPLDQMLSRASRSQFPQIPSLSNLAPFVGWPPLIGQEPRRGASGARLFGALAPACLLQGAAEGVLLLCRYTSI
eukprot:SAG11_NODE_1867_length_4152_cov_3.687886_2_plen_232_part_00